MRQPFFVNLVGIRTKISAVIERMLRNRVQLQIELKEAAYNEVEEFEAKTGLALPDEMRTFYSLFNELYGAEDMFRIIPLSEVVEDARYTENGFDFAEYLIFCDLWSVTISKDNCNDYLISGDFPSHSFADFLERFLDGGVHQGLYK